MRTTGQPFPLEARDLSHALPTVTAPAGGNNLLVPRFPNGGARGSGLGVWVRVHHEQPFPRGDLWRRR